MTGEPERTEAGLAGDADIIRLPDQPQPEPASPPRPKPGRHTGRMKGRHFGPRPVADPRTSRIDLRVTAGQRAAIKATADEVGLSVSALICARVLKIEGPRPRRRLPQIDRAALAQILAALGRSGSNLNQLLRRVNAYDFRDIPELLDMAAAMKAAHAAHHELVAAIKSELGV